MEHNVIEKLRELTYISQSKAFRILLDERKEFAQKEVNSKVKEKDLYGAYAALAKLEDTEKLIGLIQKKVNDTQKEIEDGKE